MKVFVTGGTGFIGGHLVHELIKRGFIIRVLARNEEKARILFNRDVEIIKGDILNDSLLEKVLAGIDVVVHLASIINIGNVPENYYYRINVEGTENLLKACSKAGVKRFVFSSSVNVYPPVSPKILTEESPCAPDEILGRTKLEAENLLINFCREVGIEFIILRISRVYGPRDLSLLKLFQQIGSNFFLMLGKGKGFIQPVFVGDVVNAIILSMTKRNVINQTFIIAGSEVFTKKDFCNEIAKVMGKKIPALYLPIPLAMPFIYIFEKISVLFGKNPSISRRRARFFLTSQFFNIQKAKHILDFEPETNIREGLKATVDWYKEKGLLIFK